MPTKIRLQRRGKKGQPFYHIVIADGRAPRDGKFIERIGIYNPLTRPAEIEINFEKALEWLKNGATPTDTVKALLHYKGVMYKNHLLKGVQKVAMTPEQAEAKFQTWLQEKQVKIISKKNENALNVKEASKKAFETESKVKDAKARVLAKKLAKAEEAEREEAVEAHSPEVSPAEPLAAQTEEPATAQTPEPAGEEPKQE
jgi:small subunit ribosomal protein S16